MRKFPAGSRQSCNLICEKFIPFGSSSWKQNMKNENAGSTLDFMIKIDHR